MARRTSRRPRRAAVMPNVLLLANPEDTFGSMNSVAEGLEYEFRHNYPGVAADLRRYRYFKDPKWLAAAIELLAHVGALAFVYAGLPGVNATTRDRMLARYYRMKRLVDQHKREVGWDQASTPLRAIGYLPDIIG